MFEGPEDRLALVARLYYDDGLTQDRIAESLGISRPSVSRILKQARAEGIVEITIRDFDSALAVLSRNLQEAFGLRQVVIVPRLGQVDVKTQLGRAAAQSLGSALRPGDILGVSGGTTIYEMTKQLRSVPAPSLTIVQLMGGLAAVEDVIHAGEIARGVREAYGGRVVILSSPAKLRDPEMVSQLLDDPNIAEGLSIARSCTIAVVGIGTPKPSATLVARGYLNQHDQEELEAEAAVGDICLRFFDIDGNACARFNSRVPGISLDDISRIPLVIGVAGGGEGKAEAILGALRGKYVKTLVTDSETATEVYNLAHS